MVRLTCMIPLFILGCFSSSFPGFEDSDDASVSSDATRFDVPPIRFDAGPPPRPDTGPPPFDAGPPPFDAGPLPIEEVCRSFCEAGVACDFIDETLECTMECVAFASSSRRCEAAAASFFECNLSLECVSLLTSFDEGVDGPCGMEFVLLEEECLVDTI